MSEMLQLFPALPAAIEAALRASIQRFGVIMPVVHDQHGRLIDGYHRTRLAQELGVSYRVDVLAVRDEEEAREIAYTLNTDRRQLTPEQRQEVAKALREMGHSLRAIAGALGAGKSTIADDLAELSGAGQLTEPAYITGLDGKARRLPTVAAKTPQEATRARQALLQLGEDAPATVMDVKRVERVAREHKAAQRRQAPLPASSLPETIRIVHGDFRDVLLPTLGTAKVDAILTDPPYHREAVPLLEGLSRLAAMVLHPRGILAALVGQSYLAESLAALSQHLEYRWTGCYLAQGQRTRLNLRQVATGWKPVLLYRWPGSETLRWVNDDVFVATGDDKTHHPWGQNYAGIAAMVERLTAPGDLVVDPFLGGGTTALACHRLGRRFVGCDLDQAAIQATWERLA